MLRLLFRKSREGMAQVCGWRRSSLLWQILQSTRAGLTNGRLRICVMVRWQMEEGRDREEYSQWKGIFDQCRKLPCKLPALLKLLVENAEGRGR